MKSRIQLLLCLSLALCAHDVSAGWWRKVTCGLSCANRCIGIPVRCSYSCFNNCGRRKRSSEDEGVFLPLPLDYNSYLCDANTEITLQCFIAALKEPNNPDVVVGFNLADEDENGRISKEEFAAARWYMEGDEDDATEDLKTGNKHLREGAGGQGSGGRTRSLMDALENLHNRFH